MFSPSFRWWCTRPLWTRQCDPSAESSAKTYVQHSATLHFTAPLSTTLCRTSLQCTLHYTVNTTHMHTYTYTIFSATFITLSLVPPLHSPSSNFSLHHCPTSSSVIVVAYGDFRGWWHQAHSTRPAAVLHQTRRSSQKQVQLLTCLGHYCGGHSNTAVVALFKAFSTNMEWWTLLFFSLILGSSRIPQYLTFNFLLSLSENWMTYSMPWSSTKWSSLCPKSTELCNSTRSWR